jgi:hypothetical protein
MGLAQLLLGQEHPFSQYVADSKNTLHGAFAGLGQGTNLGSGLAAAARGAVVGQPLDDAYAVTQREKAEREKQLNYTIEAMRKAGREDLIQMAQAGYMKEAFNELVNPSNKQSLMNVGDGMIYDPNTKEWITAPGGADGGGGPYGGTSMDAQNWNILLTSDPSSPEYAAAYSQVAQPKMTLQQTEQGLVPVYSSPQLPPNIRPPSGMTPATTLGAGGASGVGTGSAIPGTQKAPTEQRARAQMMDSVISPEVERLLGDGAQNPGKMGSLGNGWDVAKDATGTAGRLVPFGLGTPSEDYLQAKNAVRTVIASYLYVASGATANPGEVDKQTEILTPQINDPPNVVADKKARLKTMADAVKALARGENVDLNAVLSGGPAAGAGSTGDPELDAALRQYGG